MNINSLGSNHRRSLSAANVNNRENILFPSPVQFQRFALNNLNTSVEQSKGINSTIPIEESLNVGAQNKKMNISKSITIDRYVWQKLNNNDADRPTNRSSSAGVIYENYFYLFGGFSFSGRLNQMHQFNFKTFKWKKLNTFGQLPSPRENNAPVVYQNQMYIFGGYDGLNWLGDFFSFDFKSFQWTQIQNEGRAPSERFGYASGLYENQYFIWGGFDGKEWLNDLYCYDFTENQWEKIVLQGDLLTPRSCPSYITLKDSMYIFGGFDGNNRLNDFNVINLQKGRVSRLTQQGQIPSPRYFHNSFIIDNKIHIFGGYDGQARLNDMFEFDLDTKNWTKIDSQDTPSGRSSMVVFVYDETLFVFGGYNGFNVLNDMYQLSFKSNLGPKSSFLKDIEAMINNPELADVVFNVENKQIYAHQAILATRSEHFKAMFTSGMKQQNSQEGIVLESIGYDTFLIILRFIYIDTLDQNLEIHQILELIVASDLFLLERLQFICEEQIIKSLSHDNVLEILQLAFQFGCNALYNACLKVVIDNITDLKITKEFQNLTQYPQILMDIIIKS